MVKKNFWLDVLILIVFTIVIFSSFSLHPAASKATIWLSIHVGTGIILIICVMLHLIWHGKWIKAVLQSGSKAKTKKFQHILTNNIGLLVTFSITAWSGLWLWLMRGKFGGGSHLVHSISRLHEIIAFLMFLLIIWHLALHWKWIKSASH